MRWLAAALAMPNRPNTQSSDFAACGYRPSQSGGKPPRCQDVATLPCLRITKLAAWSATFVKNPNTRGAVRAEALAPCGTDGSEAARASTKGNVSWSAVACRLFGRVEQAERSVIRFRSLRLSAKPKRWRATDSQNATALSCLRITTPGYELSSLTLRVSVAPLCTRNYQGHE